MAGALLGLAAGGLLGYAGEQHRARMQQKEQARQLAQQGFMDMLHNQPLAIFNPDVQKQGKQHFGDEWDMTYHSILPVASQVRLSMQQASKFARLKGRSDIADSIDTQLQNYVGEGGASPSLSGKGANGTPPTPAPTGAPTGAPTPLPGGPPPQAGAVATQDISGGGAATPPPPPSQPAPAGGVPPAATAPATAPAPAASAPSPTPASGGDPAAFASSMAEQYMASGNEDAAKEWLAIAENEGKRAAKGWMTPYQAASLELQDKRITEAKDANESRLALAAASLQSSNENRDILRSMKKSEDRAHNIDSFDKLRSSFGTQIANIAAGQKKGIPDATVKTELDRLNSRLKSAKARADMLGIPYNADEFVPIVPGEIESRLQAYTGGIFGSPTATLEPETGGSGSGGKTDALVGKSTSKADGKYTMGGKTYIVAGGKITGVE